MSKLLENLKTRKESLIKENEEIKTRLTQISQVKSKLEQTYIYNQGSMREIDSLINELSVSKEMIEDDTTD